MAFVSFRKKNTIPHTENKNANEVQNLIQTEDVKEEKRRDQSGKNSRSGCASAIPLLRTLAVLGISGFPHGEPYRSHHCQNMKTGVMFSSPNFFHKRHSAVSTPCQCHVYRNEQGELFAFSARPPDAIVIDNTVHVSFATSVTTHKSQPAITGADSTTEPGKKVAFSGLTPGRQHLLFGTATPLGSAIKQGNNL